MNPRRSRIVAISLAALAATTAVGVSAASLAAASDSGATHAAATLYDANGSAMVIHAGEDDLGTDRTGKSGGRVASGVIGAG